jgi:hypothetical protein
MDCSLDMVSAPCFKNSPIAAAPAVSVFFSTESLSAAAPPAGDKCHRETRHVFRQRVSAGGGTIDKLLPHLLFLLADVFCFFSNNLGGFRLIA